MITARNANIRKAAAALPPPAARPRIDNGRNKTTYDDAEHPKQRRQRQRANAALLTTHSEIDESDEETNIVLVTSLRNRNSPSPHITYDSEEEDEQHDDMPSLVDMSDDEEDPDQNNTYIRPTCPH